MTEQEAIEGLEFFKGKLYNGIFGNRVGVFDFAISALEEVRRYRALGTVRQVEDFIADWRKCRELGNLEELREAMERQRAKKMKVRCPECGTPIKRCYFNCPGCGQVIDWD